MVGSSWLRVSALSLSVSAGVPSFAHAQPAGHVRLGCRESHALRHLQARHQVSSGAHPAHSGGDAVRDRDMVGAPELSVSALARYEWPAFDGTLAVQGWGSFQDEIWYDIQNHPISKEDGYTIVNFRTSYTSGDDAWEVYAFVNNAFEEEYKSYTFDFTGLFGFNQQAAGSPR